jgi:hypothetical protein
MDLDTILGLSVGIVMIGYGGHSAWKGSSTSSWRAVPGEITDSDVEEHQDDGEGLSSGNTYAPVVRYSYTVHGKSLTGERISFGRTNYQTEGGAQEVVNKYRAGRKVRVFVSPQDPSETVLETGVPVSSWLIVAAGIVMLFIGPWLIRHAS